MPEENQGGSPAGADTGSTGAGGAQQGSGEGQSSQSVQTGAGQQQSTQTPDFVVPEAYRERGWAGKVKSVDDAFKLIDNQDQLIGKKVLTAIDYTKATPEEIAEHHAKLAPQDRSAYKFNKPDDPVSIAVADVFMKAGINEHQGNQILSQLHPVIMKMQEDQGAQATSEEGYIKLSQEAFGDKFKETLGRVEAVLKQNAPDDASKKVFDDLPNDQRIAVDKTVNKIVEGYENRIAQILREHGITESGAQGEGGQGKVSSSVDDQRKDLRAQIRKIDARPHTASEKQALIDKLNSTYNQK